MTGADVRFRYTVDSEFADAAREAADRVELDFANAGAVMVKVEPIKNVTTRARAPEVVEALTIGDKLEVCWTAKGTHPGPERAAILKEMAIEIEQEARQ
jgi:hypothetical protein